MEHEYELIQEWMDIALYDLETARAMFETNRHLYVLFMCQQSMEKALKALYVAQHRSVPPRTHNLAFLIEKLNVVLTDTQRQFLLQIGQFYIESRYPQERAELMKAVDVVLAADFLNKTEEVFTCLKQQCPHA